MSQTLLHVYETKASNKLDVCQHVCVSNNSVISVTVHTAPCVCLEDCGQTQWVFFFTLPHQYVELHLVYV